MNLLGLTIFVVLIGGIWVSYRFFMRGDTGKERVAKLLPPAFKPDVFHRKGDTYVGYEGATKRLVLIDWPHCKVLMPTEIRAVTPVSESMLGVTHHWLAVDVPGNPMFSQYRIWFQFRRAPRDLWRDRLAKLSKEG